MNSQNKRPLEYYMVLLWQYDTPKDAFHWHAIPKGSEEHAIALHDDIVQRTGARQVTIVHLPEHIVARRPLFKPRDWQTLVKDRAEIAGFNLQTQTKLLESRVDWKDAVDKLKEKWPGEGDIPSSMHYNAAAFGHFVAARVAQYVVRRKY